MFVICGFLWWEAKLEAEPAIVCFIWDWFFVVRKARGIAYNSFWVYEPETGAYNGCSPRFLPTMLRPCCIYQRIPQEQEAVRPATAPPRMNSGALVGSSLFELRLSLGSFQSKRYQEAVRPNLNRTKSPKSHADGPTAAKSVWLLIRNSDPCSGCLRCFG